MRRVTSASTRDPFFFGPSPVRQLPHVRAPRSGRRARRLSRPPHPPRVCSSRRRPPVRFVCPPPVAALPSAAVAAPSPSPVVKPAARCSRSSPRCRRLLRPVAAPLRRLLRPVSSSRRPVCLLRKGGVRLLCSGSRPPRPAAALFWQSASAYCCSVLVIVDLLFTAVRSIQLFPLQFSPWLKSVLLLLISLLMVPIIRSGLFVLKLL